MEKEQYKLGTHNLTEEEYRAIKALNHSSIKNLFPPKTPLDFIHYRDHPPESTPAMDFGTAVHLAVLQPDIVESRIAIMPDFDRRTKIGKEDYAEFVMTNKGKIFLNQDQADSINWIVDAVERNTYLQLLLGKEKLTEVSAVFDWDGVLCKFRADCVLPYENLIIDLKTTQAGHERAFAHSVHEYCYHTQAEFYMTGMELITADAWCDFLWVVVESKPPHHIYIYEPEKTWLTTARDMLQNAIDLFRECETNKHWPGVDPVKRVLPAPKWY